MFHALVRVFSNKTAKNHCHKKSPFEVLLQFLLIASFTSKLSTMLQINRECTGWKHKADQISHGLLTDFKPIARAAEKLQGGARGGG